VWRNRYGSAHAARQSYHDRLTAFSLRLNKVFAPLRALITAAGVSREGAKKSGRRKED